MTEFREPKGIIYAMHRKKGRCFPNDKSSCLEWMSAIQYKTLSLYEEEKMKMII